MSVTTQSTTPSTLPNGTAISTTPGDGGIVQVVQPPANTTGSGTFTAADAVVLAPVGDGTLVTGASTAGSVIAVVMPHGYTSWTLLMKGWVNGTVYTEASFNSTNGTDGDWVEVKARRTGTAPGTESVVYALVANGYYRGNGAGFTYLRARFVGGATFPTIAYSLSKALGATFLNSGIPGGSSTIGNVGLVAGVAAIGSVSVSNFPATQPVSIAAALSTNATLAAETTKVIGTVNVAAAQSIAVTQAALTKGTQGATGVSTQDLKDAGRNQTNWFMAAPIITTAAEVMQSMTGYKGGAAVAATVTPAVVTTGKTYRINKIVLTYFNVATVGSALVRLRANTAGVAVVTSPLVMAWQVGLSGDGASTAGHASTYDFGFPDGLEFAAGTGIAFGVIGEGAVPTTATIVGYVMIQCFGYEY